MPTWHVTRLDGTEGSTVPLDKVELADLGSFPAPSYAFCSSRWFDYHQAGVWEVWDSYWVPVYNQSGVATGRRTNLAYSVDLVRGLDVYAVDLPGGVELTSEVSLASTDPFAALSWPEDALPITLVGSAILVFLVLRRRAAVRARSS